MNAVPPIPLITLTSDFGTRDGYAGAMKGVIRSVAPEVRIEEITHHIPAGDIRAGAWALRTAVPFFPRGTVHVVVVDPGVGTDRHAIILQVDSQYLIGPDNGVFSWMIQEGTDVRAWKLSDDSWHPDQTSTTFHGRDLFAHAAALMVQEGELERVCGSELLPRWEDWAKNVEVKSGAEGDVVHVDQFGNVVTNLLVGDAGQEHLCVTAFDGGLKLCGVNRTYGDVDSGEALLLIGSHGFLEIAVSQGSASEAFGLKCGDQVKVELV
ncbi:SAM-dependent chlorinase/fluorinase [Kiritimatiellota bacterium B12222]|nr:SAM-dependent chlorinase/fluorinase [Kiritimatiellota bacterium B12222]